jgi:ribosomal subunit interface protein
MQINLQSHGFALTDALDRHARRRLQFALDRFADPIETMTVRLARDHGGRTSRCRLHVQLRGRPDVLVEETRDDLYAAIDRAADRAAGAVARSVQRGRRASVRGARGTLDARTATGKAMDQSAEDLS